MKARKCGAHFDLLPAAASRIGPAGVPCARLTSILTPIKHAPLNGGNMRFLDRFALALALLAMPAIGAVAETPVERGRDLVTTIAACGNCHTPRNADKKPVAGRELSGGVEFQEPRRGESVGAPTTHPP